MPRYDRYVLSRLLLLFGFFALILVAVFWINRAVGLFDRLIGDGQTAMVFLEFTALTLPNLVRIVLPMAVFAATVYVTNRMSGESELIVMQATGSGPWRLARPVLWFGLIAGAMMAVLTHVLLPASVAQLQLREAEVSQNVTARLLTEGEFLHPAHGVTFFAREIGVDGTLNDVFLSDRRAEDEVVTYTAARAFLLRDGDRARLIMVDGLAQRLETAERRLSTTNFEDFSYDITALLREDTGGGRNIRALPTLDLITDSAGIQARDGYAAGELAEELHLRFARPLICVAVALIGFSALMLGGYSRLGIWWQILLAFILLIGLEVLRGVVSGPVLADAGRWPLIYAPAVLGLAIAALFLWRAARPHGRIPPGGPVAEARPA